ncbi:hypothetical protein D4M24_12145 [Escherichia coli]|nr:hypothetical protein D4M24_12145 [Escherichia coli]
MNFEEHSSTLVCTMAAAFRMRTLRREACPLCRYPKNWVTTGDPAREFTMIQSAPLMLLAD